MSAASVPVLRRDVVRSTMGTTTANVATAVGYHTDSQAMAWWTSSSGLTNSLGYDTDGRLTGIDVPGVQSLAFSYDGADRISRIANGIDGSLTQSFGYDAMSRLSSVASAASNENYQYDANGNRIAQAVNSVSTPSTVSATSNRLTGFGATTYGYDVNGNMTTVAGAPRYHYDAFNRMDSAAGTSYYVNPEGQRLRKSGSAGTSYFAADQSNAMLSEYTGGWIDYVWLNGRLIGRVAGGQLYAIHNDQVGRPEAVTNASKAIVWRAQNFAFNQNLVTSGITFNLGFPGQYYDAETSAWNNGYRDYKSELGRYLQSDPIGLDGGVNTYVYAGNNPLNNIDQLGLQYLTAGMPSLSPFPSNATNCQKNALANGVAQMVPFAGLYLTLTGQNFTPSGDGSILTSSPASAWDVMSGTTGAAAGFANSNAANAIATSYIESGFRDLSTGNKAYRRAASSAQRVMWGGTSKALGAVGKSLGPVGVLSAYLGAVDDVARCGCDK
jgi:RHS repeat-associated protein